MKYNDNGTIKDIVIKAGDTLPVGTVVRFDGDIIPSGWEEVGNIDNMKLIRKTYNGVVPNGKVLNSNSSSVTDTYSCDYTNALTVNEKTDSTEKSYSCDYINNKIDNITEGYGITDTNYISAAENNHWEKCGNIVSYSFTLKVKGTWTSTNSFISGLPKPKKTIRFIAILDTSPNKIMRLSIATDGKIHNAYSTENPPVGANIEGQITYITTD